MMTIDYAALQKKWQKAWEDAKLFYPEPDDRKPLLVTGAIPYVNSPPHTGHIRTYGTADTYARYMRMKGYNVLMPFGFHATGTPLVGFAKRIANNDTDLIEELKIFHVSDEDIKKMTDPKYIADYFIKQQESEWRKVGLGIDWRRKFVSTDSIFSKFVEWQFYRLRDKGYLTQGTHPVGWCTNENNAVGQHDTMHDMHPKVEEQTAIKFKEKSTGIYFPCATYRPETVYGVTNVFVNSDSIYVIAELNGDMYCLAKEAARILSYQFDISVKSELPGKELLDRVLINPVTNDEVQILPGFFVKPDVGTGIVMSVPVHAPFDYVALEKLKSEGYPVPKMEYKKVIDTGKSAEQMGKSVDAELLAGTSIGPVAHPEIPALAYLELFNIDVSANGIDDAVERATKAIYKEESTHGVMLLGEYKGKSEVEARELLKNKLVESKDAINIYIIGGSDPVYCRCGTKVIVNMVKDQWFIDYGNKEWKDEVRNALKEIRIYPEKYRKAFENTVEWVDLRAAERAQGLGTPLPFKPEHIIESLSDSTLYMTFYTYDHILRSADVKPEQLLPEFFDYVINGIGDTKSIAEHTGIDEMVIKKCRESLNYWYTNTSRHSAPDLVPNHLTMYIFNHVALMDKRFWPKQIVVNGFVNYEGEKMSKSLGNIIPAGDSVDKYGSDVIRTIELTGSDLDSETEFNEGLSRSMSSKIESIFSVLEKMETMESSELKDIDFWLYEKMYSKINMATKYMDSIMFKNAYNEVLYNSLNEVQRYFNRGGRNKLVLQEYVSNMIRMLAPVMPHVAEETWSILGNKSLVAKEAWPEPAASADEGILEFEELLDSTVQDITQAITLTSKIDANKDKSVKSIRIILADDWKATAYNMLAEKKKMSEAIQALDNIGVGKDIVAKFLSQFKNPNELKLMHGMDSEKTYAYFDRARTYISGLLNADVVIEKEKDSESARASRALPQKPGIEIIWN